MDPFMERQKIELAHKGLLQPLLQGMGSLVSEYSFANLYLFSQKHEYELVQMEELYIAGTSYDGFRFLMPTSLKGLESLVAKKALLEGIDFLFPIAEEWLGLVDLSAWQAYYKEEDSDYLFDMEQMANYKGRHLSKKRNLVKQLQEHYEVRHQPLEKGHLAQAEKVLELWHQHVAVENDAFGDGTNTKPCKEALARFEELSLDGEIYFIDEVPVGFLIGEMLCQDTYVIHFAKADIRYKGIYQYMYQSLAQKMVPYAHFLNMEQDLGRQDLRQAKHSYQPIKMCKKLRLVPRLSSKFSA